MIDIETLDNVPSAVILSIAAVVFDPFTGETGESFHMHCSIDDQIKNRRTITESTLLWWFEQTDKARQNIVEAARVTLFDALLGFSRWKRSISENKNVFHDDVHTWANSPSFDMVILENAWGQYMEHSKLFEEHWLHCDVRTLKQYVVFEDFDWPGGTEHDALSDCYDQIAIVHAFYMQYGILRQEE